MRKEEVPTGKIEITHYNFPLLCLRVCYGLTDTAYFHFFLVSTVFSLHVFKPQPRSHWLTLLSVRCLRLIRRRLCGWAEAERG